MSKQYSNELKEIIKDDVLRKNVVNFINKNFTHKKPKENFWCKWFGHDLTGPGIRIYKDTLILTRYCTRLLCKGKEREVFFKDEYDLYMRTRDKLNEEIFLLEMDIENSK
jgi:hypothetical protein